MSLLTTNIIRAKRLSIVELRTPTPEPQKPIRAPQRIPTEDELVYSQMLAINPLIADLMSRFSLVSSKTGAELREVEVGEEVVAVADKTEPASPAKIKEIAERILQPMNSYSREEIIAGLQDSNKISQERAEKGFSLFLSSGAIEEALDGRYILSGSTPF